VAHAGKIGVPFSFLNFCYTEDMENPLEQIGELRASLLRLQDFL
jgi:hypothetical protein